MTANDQFIVFAERALKDLDEVRSNLESALEVLKNHASPRKDRHAHQTTMLLSEIANGVITATVASSMLEKNLRYARISAPDAQIDQDTE